MFQTTMTPWTNITPELCQTGQVWSLDQLSMTHAGQVWPYGACLGYNIQYCMLVNVKWRPTGKKDQEENLAKVVKTILYNYKSFYN